MTANSSNPGLISNDRIVLSGSGSSRTVTLSPLSTQFGAATITLTVMDLAGATSGTGFTLTVNPINDPPTLDPIANLLLNENAGQQTVSLTGISSGAPNENQALTVAASSSNPIVALTETSHTPDRGSDERSFGARASTMKGSANTVENASMRNFRAYGAPNFRPARNVDEWNELYGRDARSSRARP